MSDEKKPHGPTPPYVAYKTFKNFVRSLSQAMPDRIDKSVMGSMAGGTQSQILHALKYLNLITATGVPNDNLEKLARHDPTVYQKTLSEILLAQYPFLSSGAITLRTATMHQLEEAFKRLAGGDTVRKCMTFFIPAAKDAEIVLSPYIKEFGKHSRNVKPKKQPNASAPKTKVDEEEILPTPSEAPSWHQMLLEKFPNFDPAWPEDVKAKWFESFEKLMQHGR